jgi:hypothetical protein
VRAGRLGQGTEEEGGDPVVLGPVGHDEGHFRFGGGRGPVVAGDGDESAGLLGDEGQPVDPVDMGEAFDLGGREDGMDGEEAPVDRPGGELTVEVDQPGRVVGPDGSE